MPEYKSVKDITEDTGSYKKYYAEKVSWSVREGIAKKELNELVSKEAHILDFGAGGGAFLKSLRDEGYQNLYGTDLENYLADIKKEDLKDFVEANINSEQLPLKNGSLDVVTALAFVEHIENAFQFFRESARVLTSGGYLLFTLPNIHNVKSRLRFLTGKNLDGYTSHNDHIMVLPDEVLKKSFQDNFELVETIYGNAFIKIPLINKKIRRVPKNRFFGNKVLFVLRKK